MGKYLLGVNNIWAVKRFVEPEEWVEIAATRMEVNYVQFMLDLLDPRTEETALQEMVLRTRDCCRRYGVTIQSCFAGLAAYTYNLLMHPSLAMRNYAFEWYSKAVVLTSMLGGEAVGGPVGALSLRDHRDARRREFIVSELLDSIRSLNWVGRRLGLKYFMLEPMPVPREPPATIEESRKMLELANRKSPLPVKLCLDVGHICNPESKKKSDHDPYAWLERLGADAPVVHLQQTDGRTDRHWYFTEEYNKKGIIRGDRVVSALDRSGARSAYLFFECIGPFEQPEEEVVRDMVQSIKYWKNFV